jgi:hypothetical protein
LKHSIPYQGYYDLGGLIPFPSYLVQIRNPVNTSNNGVPERDLAVRNGADGGMTLQYFKQHLSIPGLDSDLLDQYPQTVETLENTLNLKPNDVIFIAFSSNKATAAFAAITVGLWMMTP